MKSLEETLRTAESLLFSTTSSACISSRQLSDAESPDSTLTAEFGRLDRILGPTRMTELALHSAIVDAIPINAIVPEKVKLYHQVLWLRSMCG